MHAGLASECSISILVVDLEDSLRQGHACLAVAIDVLVFEHIRPQASVVAEGLVHAEQVASENGRLGATGAWPNLDQTWEMGEWMDRHKRGDECLGGVNELAARFPQVVGCQVAQLRVGGRVVDQGGELCNRL